MIKITYTKIIYIKISFTSIIFNVNVIRRTCPFEQITKKRMKRQMIPKKSRSKVFTKCLTFKLKNVHNFVDNFHNLGILYFYQGSYC